MRQLLTTDGLSDILTCGLNAPLFKLKSSSYQLLLPRHITGQEKNLHPSTDREVKKRGLKGTEWRAACVRGLSFQYCIYMLQTCNPSVQVQVSTKRCFGLRNCTHYWYLCLYLFIVIGGEIRDQTFKNQLRKFSLMYTGIKLHGVHSGQF